MKTTGDNHKLYLKTDVLLFADVFEEFRSVCLGNYEFDSWYYTAPGWAWDAALKETDIQLELLTDVDMLLMIEKGILGVSMILNYFEGKIIHILVITTIQAIQQNTSLILM